MNVILHYAPDNASLIVRMALEELGVPYETRLVDRAARAQESEAYRALNPAGLIPCIELDGRAVFETAAILLTLAERAGALAPIPGDEARPRFLSHLFYVSNTLHAELRQLFYPEKYASADLPGHRARSAERLTRAFALMDAAYPEASPWFGGGGPTIIDLYLAATLRWVQIYPAAAPGQVDPSAFPRLMRMARALEVRSAISRACEAEGIAPPFFTAATRPDPPEGSAT